MLTGDEWVAPRFGRFTAGTHLTGSLFAVQKVTAMLLFPLLRVFNTSLYRIVSDDKMTDESERIWKEAVLA
jgi:hypothetical protein